jgi:hypothetical protein
MVVLIMAIILTIYHCNDVKMITGILKSCYNHMQWNLCNYTKIIYIPYTQHSTHDHQFVFMDGGKYGGKLKKACNVMLIDLKLIHVLELYTILY